MDTGVKQPAAALKPTNKAREPFPESALKAIVAYEIIEKVGQGGMGAVYKARQRSLDRIVALKLLPPEIARDRVFIERFQREARTSARLCHTNVVQGIDAGQDPATGLWYFAMEFVDGPTLKKVIKEARCIPERKALEIVREVARGLEGIASLGMVHRDVKPDNILLSRRGEVKIADLGLTRAADDDSDMTQSGQAVGTPHYMAPEQVRGLNDLDIRMDLYALGATLFHAVTGTTPFKGSSTAEIMSHQLTETPPLAHTLNPDVSEACSRLILNLMEKQRCKRIQTPRELIARIDAMLTNAPARRNIGPRVGPKPSPLTRQTPRASGAPRCSEEPRVDAATSSARNALRPRTAPTTWALLGGGVLTAVVMGFALFSGPTKRSDNAASKVNVPAPAPARMEVADITVQAPIPSREDKARAAMNAAISFEKAHPDDFRQVRDLLKQANELAEGTTRVDAVRSAQKGLETRWAARFEERLKSLSSDADALIADGNSERAKAVVSESEISESLRVFDWSARLDAARKRIAQAAEASATKATADTHNSAKSADITPLQSKPETNNPEPQVQDTVAFEAFRQELAPLLKQNRFSAALDRVNHKLDDSASAKYRDALQREKTDLEAIIALRQQAIDAIRGSAKPVTLRRGKASLTGKVTQDAKGLNLKLADGPEMTLGIDQLEASDIHAFAPKANGATRGEDLRRRALLFLALDDFAKAREFFNAAREAGLGDSVNPYLERLDARERSELEVRAQKDWLAAESLFAAKRWEEARGAYANFAAAYKATETFIKNSDELEQRQLAIDTQLHPLHEGLVASYFRGSDLSDADRILTRIDKTIDFDWTKTPPAADVPHDNYCVRWEGLVKVPKSGRYTFAVAADDGARLWIDGKQLVNEWGAHPLTRFGADLELTAGTHDIKVEYLQQFVDAVCRLTWGLKGSFDETVVPASALWHDAKIKVPQKK